VISPFRQELATREHMLDHGQLGPPTPGLPSLTPAGSRRASNANDQIIQPGSLSRRSSSSLNVSISRRPSNANTQPPRTRKGSSSHDGLPTVLSALGGRSLLESLSMSALETEDDGDDSGNERIALNNSRTSGPPSRRPSLLSMDNIGRDLSDALDAAAAPSSVEPSGPEEPSRTLHAVVEDRDSEGSSGINAPSSQQQPQQETPKQTSIPIPSTQYASPADLAAQLNSHPKLAALRVPPSFAMTSITAPSKQHISPPILMNPKCSGYFVEPVRSHFLH